MKWESIEPEPDTFTFGPADEIVSFAESVGAKVRGHNFEWSALLCSPEHCGSQSALAYRTMLVIRGNQLAPWVNSSLTATELDRALKNHITKIMDHFRGKLYAWDVIVST